MKAKRSAGPAAGYGISLLGIAALTAVLASFFPTIHQSNLTALYLLVVLVSATTFGLGPGILASIVAFLAFNYFFVAPLHTLLIETSQDLIGLLTFLLVAMVTSSLAGTARAQADTAARSAGELETLYGLSQGISAEVDLDRILPLVARMTLQLIDVPMCAVLLYSAEGRLEERAVSGAPPPHPTHHVDAFLRSGPRVLGLLRVLQRSVTEPLSVSERERLDTIAAQVLLVLERARLVAEVGRAQSEAAAERVKGVLLSSVSHDLRTPLAVIKGAVTNLLDPAVDWQADARGELLGAIDQETDRLNRLLGNLLDMSRIESGAWHPQRGWHDLAELIATVLGRMRPLMAGHPLSADIPAALPPLLFSYAQIEQVLTNILENAAKYTPAGTPVTLAVRAEPDLVRVAIADRGPGIPVGMEARIFEKFVRTAGPERHADGTGLGLAICKGIIEAHGGRIWAASLPGGGACFTFTLPLAPLEMPAGDDARDERP